MLKINAYSTITTIIQVYIPTTTHDDDEIKEVYDQIGEVLKMTKTEENIRILGDWNASVGSHNDGYMIRNYELEKINKRGERLIQFCSQHRLVLANTLLRTTNGEDIRGKLLEIQQDTK